MLIGASSSLKENQTTSSWDNWSCSVSSNTINTLGHLKPTLATLGQLTPALAVGCLGDQEVEGEKKHVRDYLVVAMAAIDCKFEMLGLQKQKLLKMIGLTKLRRKVW